MPYTYESAYERHYFNEMLKKLSPQGTLFHLGGLLAWAAQQYGERTALMCQDKRINYNDLYTRVQACAKRLRDEHGIVPGQTVLVWLENSIEFYIAYFAILQLGAVVAPLNVYLTQRELLHVIADAQAKLIITAHSFKDRLADAHIEIPILFKEDLELLESPLVPQTLVPYKGPAQDLAVLLYTSGTTGLPKGVALSSKNAIINALQGIVRYPTYVSTSTVLCALPLFHSFTQNACIWAPIIYGATIIIVPKVDRRMILQGLAQKPTVVLGVPALYGLFCLMKTAPLEEVKMFISGGDALPNKIRAAFALIYNRTISSGYGMTETSPLVSVDMDDLLEATNCVGRPCIDVAVDIRDAQNNPCPAGTVGQLWVSGPNVMLGYHNAPQATAEILHDGWLNTGDLAYINERGKIVIAGREKDLIKHKGFNIYPQEIENVLMGHPLVMRAAVIGVPDPAGQVPVAYVQIRHADAAVAQDLKKRCVEQLAAYKVPKEFIVTSRELPLTGTGKVDKKVLVREYNTGEQA
jgi:long-chain acyl-CoA synthetase